MPNAAEEISAVQYLCEYLVHQGFPKPEYSYEPNGLSKPPDFQIRFPCNTNYAVEIRRSGAGIIVRDQIPINDACIDSYQGVALSNFDTELKKCINKWLPKDTVLIVSLKSPVPKRGRKKLAKEISKVLLNFYKDKNCNGDESIDFHVDTKDEDLSTLIISTNMHPLNDDEESVILIHACTFRNTYLPQQNSLSFQAHSILEMVIAEKSKKLREIKEKKWLVIINTHPLLTEKIYSKSFRDIDFPIEQLVFDRIFIIFNGHVTALYQRI